MPSGSCQPSCSPFPPHPLSRRPIAIRYGEITARWPQTNHNRQRTDSSILIVGFAVDEDLALPSVIGLPDHALLFHALHERGGPVVADLQPPLDVAGGSLAVTPHDLNRLLIKVAAIGLSPHAGRVEHRVSVDVQLVLHGGYGFEVLRLPLRLEVT